MSIENFIDKIQTQDFTNASPIFGELMSSKLADALDQAKIKIANEVFNAGDDDDEYEDLEELSDEEIDEILDDEDDEE
jgi:predicted phosphoribosyltransferase